MKKKKVVDDRHAQSNEYGEVLKKIADGEWCPFCPENRLRNDKPIEEIHRVGKWILTQNNFSYQEAQIKLMIIGDKHIENFSELTPGDWYDVTTLVSWAINKYEIQGGGLAIRFGDTQFTGATVCHLHFHLISPNLDDTDASIPIYFPIG